MNKEFTLYEESLALKELGFDEPCFAGYNSKDGRKNWFTYPSAQDPNTTKKPRVYKEYSSRGMKGIIKAPLYQQAFRWFRDKHNLLGTVESEYFDDNSKQKFHPLIKLWADDKTLSDKGLEHDELEGGLGNVCATYEEAELACLKKLIKIVKNK